MAKLQEELKGAAKRSFARFQQMAESLGIQGRPITKGGKRRREKKNGVNGQNNGIVVKWDKPKRKKPKLEWVNGKKAGAAAGQGEFEILGRGNGKKKNGKKNGQVGMGAVKPPKKLPPNGGDMAMEQKVSLPKKAVAAPSPRKHSLDRPSGTKFTDTMEVLNRG